MYNIMHSSKTGMQANQNKMDIISNNISNSQTKGYKKLEIEFLDLYTETLNRPSYPHNTPGVLLGTGVKTSQETRNYEQGALKETNVKTNLAIDGEGLFRVTRSDGTYAYTRNGEFNVDAQGKIVNDNGDILNIEFNNGVSYDNIDLLNGELSINKSGEVFLDKERVGSIELYTSKGTNDFISIGDSLFVPREGTQMITLENKSIMQGYVEMSNVNMSQEMTDLIMVQRAFQFNSKGINAVDEMWGMINNLQGR